MRFQGLVLTTLAGSAIAASIAPRDYPNGDVEKRRMIILSDITRPEGEPDDMQAFIHLLAVADIFEIEAIIATSGFNIPPQPLNNTYFHQVIEDYRADLHNLMKRSGQTSFRADESKQYIGYWPSAEYFDSIVYDGYPGTGMRFVGDGKNTNGSDAIIHLADEDDDRPLYVGIWGGGNVLAQAIWDVRRTRSEEELSKFLNKINVYSIDDQDRPIRQPFGDSSHIWMKENFIEDLFFVHSYTAWRTHAMQLAYDHWPQYQEEIQGKAALGRRYPDYIYGVEGDFPCVAYVWPGMNDPWDARQSSWAGVFTWGLTEDNVTSTWGDDPRGPVANRSRDAVIQGLPEHVNDFIARLDWAADGEGNRNPTAVLNGKAGFDIIKLDAEPGETVVLSAEGSTDPDGDELAFSWQHDRVEDHYVGSLCAKGKETAELSFTVPEEADDKNIHIVLRVEDNGSPALVAYRRAIITVKSTSCEDV